jgi:MFS family permease
LGDAQVLASLAASVVLLVSFVLIERRSSRPLLPIRVLADRNRSGSYLIMLCISTGLFGLFFFLTLFIQNVLGYSAIRSGIAYLPFAIGVVIASALASQLMPRIGPRPLIVAGAAAVAGGMFWFSRLTEHASYTGQLLGPMLVSSFGLGLVFVPLALVSLHNVPEQDSGVASSLLNAAQQVGGAIGLALLGTVAWTTVADSVRTQVAHAAAAAAKAGRPLPKPGIPRPASIYDHALAVGFPVRSLLPRGSGCSPCSSRSPPSGSAARNCPVPCPRRKRRHRSPRLRSRRFRSPGLCSGMRTEPPSPRQSVLAGSASRHVITTWEKP